MNINKELIQQLICTITNYINEKERSENIQSLLINNKNHIVYYKNHYRVDLECVLKDIPGAYSYE